MRTIRHLLELIRFSHTLFALPFALLAAVMAWTTPITAHRSPHAPREASITRSVMPTMSTPTTHHSPFTLPPFHWQHLVGILVCMVGARSAAMAFNRLVDRQVDAENPRTKMRHLPAGLLAAGSVIAFTVASSLLFLVGTLLFLPNRLPLALAIPVLLFLLGYSYAKRFTALAHFWLGSALMLAPVCVWIALRGELLLADPADLVPALLLGAAVLAWVSGFDIIYACQDADFDRKARLRSVPAVLGVLGALRLAAACHFATLVLLAALPLVCPQVPLGWIYGTGVALVAALLVYEHLLVRPDDLTRVNVAFFNINAVISIGLLIVGAIDLLT
jgi:4-hydroxybenzoate polyprenyltransferase